VEKEVSWTWGEFLALPRMEVTSDVHCVTRWSRYDNRWEGVAVREVLSRAGVQPQAVAVMAHTQEGYTTNIPLSDLRGDDVILAFKHDGQDLPHEHGGPCRLVVPKLYFWKSAKWIRAFEFSDVNAPGFWEVNGYHLHADPWKEERALLGPGDRCNAADALGSGAPSPESLKKRPRPRESDVTR
jgi:DMSO/TMAO reductase YedYZ molybdopterin-dependent catalytic subunit